MRVGGMNSHVERSKRSIAKETQSENFLSEQEMVAAACFCTAFDCCVGRTLKLAPCAALVSRPPLGSGDRK